MSTSLDQESAAERAARPPEDRPRSSKSSSPAQPQAGRWLLPGVALLVALSGLLVWKLLLAGTAVSYRFATVERGDLVATVNASGNLEAINNVEIGSQVSGRILQLYADFNSRVKKGQLLAVLDPADFQSRVDQSQAGLQAAQASVSEAQAGIARAQAGLGSAMADLHNNDTSILKAQVDMKDKYNKMVRARNLYSQGYIAQADKETTDTTYSIAVQQVASARAQKANAQAQYGTARAQVATAQASYEGALARLKQAQASLRAAQLDLSHTRITSPINGVVVQRAMDVGQTVAASFQAPKLFVVADLKKMRVTAHIDEADVGKIKVKQPASFNVDAYPKDTFDGQVNQVRMSPTTSSNVVTYDAIIEVDNSAGKLKPGMTANLTLTVDHKENVLKVPNAALRYKPTTVSASASPGPGGSGMPGAGGGRWSGASGAPGGWSPQGGGDLRQGRGGRNRGDRGRVWVLDDKGQPGQVRVRVGISDDTSTEVSSRNLKEGQKVIIGEVSPTQTASPATTTPFGNMGGPRGGRGGGGGR